jgi:AraC-type DNA-binding domain-containing proteins
MAEKLHISCGHLQNIYKDTFFISCMSEVIESRITYAKELLIESNLSISEVSNLCGYQNEVHFMKQFKKLTTLTPTEYRRLNGDLGKY